ncbi:aldehyde dehydrogenase family protein [Propionibacterium acidifaciens]|uniref:aldehyde dehydrogenase family protein n=1 Tax=Propionibacterium acidifaciens TaxID=556499 RepID=UPI0009DB7EA0|nr:aldehyde dehydrogenase family protein [Propionibacterium acidifaciens]
MTWQYIPVPQPDPCWTGSVFVAGWQPVTGELTVTDPFSGGQLAVVGACSTREIDRALTASLAAQPAWAAARQARISVLSAAADAMSAGGDALVAWLVHETGSSVAKARLEVGLAAAELREAAELAKLTFDHPLPGDKRQSTTHREPIGVVAVIAPFNFPAHLAIRAIAPALALGNTVVLKPHPCAAISGGLWLAGMFEASGLPAGVLSVIPGDAEIGEALVADPRVGQVTFTGSVAVGQRIAETAASQLTPTLLELGGNNALVVLRDADVELAASCGGFGSFYHQGQVCMSTGRHLVHESSVEAYVQALVNYADRLQVGDPADSKNDLGPLINARQLARVDGLVRRSVAVGSELVLGGTNSGLCYHPTVLIDPTRRSPAWQEEIFGPVAVVAPFSDDQDVVAIVNEQGPGLVASILCADVDRGSELGARIACGIVHVNEPTIDYQIGAPFGGWGASGNSTIGDRTSNVVNFTKSKWFTRRLVIPQR